MITAPPPRRTGPLDRLLVRVFAGALRVPAAHWTGCHRPTRWGRLCGGQVNHSGPGYGRAVRRRGAADGHGEWRHRAGRVRRGDRTRRTPTTRRGRPAGLITSQKCGTGRAGRPVGTAAEERARPARDRDAAEQTADRLPASLHRADPDTHLHDRYARLGEWLQDTRRGDGVSNHVGDAARGCRVRSAGPVTRWIRGRRRWASAGRKPARPQPRRPRA